MDKIFAKEQKVLEMAEKLLSSCHFDTEADQENYRVLYEEYKVLLKQTVKVIHLADRVQLELKSVSKELRKASREDALTGLYNRTYFMNNCSAEWKSAVRSGSTLALLMIDVDFFKEYNDTYGHIRGDECLKVVTSSVKSEIKRPRDMIGRYGGDEFVILLPETGIIGAGVVAENILNEIGRLSMEHKGSDLFGKVTLSIGVTAITPNQDIRMESLYQQADKALYKAKNDGRNCFRIYELDAKK